ncbi:MAG: DUF2505 domain-containing protein [Myxococcota bacterium]
MDMTHELPGSAAFAWKELHSAEYVEASRATTQTKAERLSEEPQADGTRFVRTRVTLARELPRVAANLLGSKYLTYVLEEKIDDTNFKVQWRVIPDRISDKVKAAGTFEIEPIDDSRCNRIVRGDVKVSVPLIGGRIEKGIAADLAKSYEATAQFAREWLQKRLR